MKKTMFKKSISLMLTVLMVLSCWVFFPGMVPEASAVSQDASSVTSYASYHVKLNVEFSNCGKGGSIVINYYPVNADGSLDTNNPQEYILVNSLSQYSSGVVYTFDTANDSTRALDSNKTFSSGGYDANAENGPVNGWPYGVTFQSSGSITSSSSLVLHYMYIGNVQTITAGTWTVKGRKSRTFGYNGNDSSISGYNTNWTVPSWSNSSTISDIAIKVPTTGSNTVFLSQKAAWADQYGVTWSQGTIYSVSGTGVTISQSNNTLTGVTVDSSALTKFGSSKTKNVTVTATASGLNKTQTANITLQAPVALTYENLFNFNDFVYSESIGKGGSGEASTGSAISYDFNAGTITATTGGGEVFTTSNSSATHYSVPVSSDKEYKLDFDAEYLNAIQTFVFFYNDAGEAVAVPGSTDTFYNSYSNAAITFTPPAGATRVGFRFGTYGANGNYAKYSNIRLYETSRQDIVDVMKAQGINRVIYNYNDLIETSTIPTPTREGYTFNGWFVKDVDNTGDGQWDSVNDYAVGGSMQYNMQQCFVVYSSDWTEHTYNIAFDANSGSGSTAGINSVLYTADTKLTTNGFSKTGYTFNGWNTKADGTGTAYADGATVSKLSATNGATVTLYAQWKVNSYNVTFDFAPNANGDTASSVSKSYDYGTTPSAPNNTASDYDANYHYTYSWPAIGTVTGTVTYEEIKTPEAHTYTESITKAPTCTAEGVKTFTCDCGYSYTEAISANGHTPGASATCTTAQTCTVCGVTITGALGHTAGEVKVENNVDPDCVKTGSYDNVVYCTVCNAELSRDTVTVDALGHTEATREENRNDATCGADGSYDLVTYCSVCGTVIKTEAQTIPATGAHSLGDWVTDKAPTCITAGSKHKACKNCDYTETETISATGEHVYGEWAQYNNGTTHRRVCTADVNCSAFEEGAHTFGGQAVKVDDSYHWYPCELCGTAHGVDATMNAREACYGEGTTYTQIDGDAINHTAICKCGNSKSDGHAWSGWVADPENKTDNQGQMSNTCSECNYKKTSGCNYGVAKTENATCTDDGYKTYTCNDCGNGYTEILSATGHTESAAVEENRVESTCTVAGSYDSVVYCLKCDEELSRETKTLELAAHTEGAVVVENEKEATCTSEGSYDNVVYCTVCDEELSRNTVVVDKIAHTPAEAVEENKEDSTCYAEGSYDEVVYCSVEACKYEISRTEKTIEKKEHTPAEAVKENEIVATCGADGSYDSVVYCSVCNAEISRNKVTVPATGAHVYATETDRKEATCTVDGYVVMACGCGATETTTLIAPGHTEGEVIVENNKAPGCVSTGSYDNVVYCTVCNAELSRDTVTVDATGHKYEGVVTTAPTCTEKGVKTYTCKNDASHTYTEEVAANGHSLTQVEAKAATCEAIGWNAYEKCTVCSYTTYVEIPATGHKYEGVVTAPTCTADGYTTYTCSVCGDTYTADKVSATDHDYDTTKSESNLTRPELKDGVWTKGYYTYTCKNDNTHTTTEEVDRASYTAYEVALANLNSLLSTDLTADAKEAINNVIEENKVADNLIASEQSRIDTAEANLKAAFDQYKGSLMTYTVTFKIDGSADVVMHVISGNDATAPTDVKKAYDDTYHYNFTGWDNEFTNITSDLTVTAQFDAVEHSYTTHTDKDDTYHTDKCDCGHSKDVKHTETSAVTTKASCYAVGVRTYTCSVCGGTRTETIAKRDHNIIDTTVATAPTCSATGIMNQECNHASSDEYEACDYTTTRVMDKVADAHKAEADYTVMQKATCDTDGYKAILCEYCDAELSKETIASRGHNIVDTTVATAPTCSATGIMNQECDHASSDEYEACDYTTTRVMDKVADAHKWETEYTIDKKASCDEAGSKSYHCEYCDAINTESVFEIAKRTHNYKDNGVQTDATCLADGVMNTICTNAETDTHKACTHESTRAIAKLSHSYTGEYEWNDSAEPKTHSQKCVNGCNEYGNETECTFKDVVTAPTCYADGYTTYTCTVCNNSYKADYTTREHVYVYATGNGTQHTVTCEYNDCDYTATEDCAGGTATCLDKAICEKCKTAWGETDANNHVGEANVTKNAKVATCTAEGYTGDIHWSCCDALETKGTTIAKIPHKDENTDHTCDYGCTVYQGTHADSATDSDHVCDYGCGVTLEECSDKSGDDDHNCDVCGKVDVTKHTYSDASCDAPATCTECGEETGDKLGHDFVFESTVKNTCTTGGYDIYKCSRCTATEHRNQTEATHTLTNVDAKEPTCTEIGWNAYEYCTACDYTTYAEKAALNHKDTLVQVEAKAPTCDEIGWEAYEYCTACDYTTYAKIDAIGHKNKAHHGKISATCLATGTIEYWSCPDCSKNFSDEECTTAVTELTIAIDKDAHTTDKTHVDGYLAPTCTTVGATGDEKYDCCNAIKVASKEIPVLDHKPAAAVTENNVPASCGTDGSYDLVVKCTECGTEISRDTVIVPATGEHVYATEKDRKEATCTEDGYVVMACGCGADQTTILPATDHDYVGEITTDPTCTTDGVKTFTCKNDASHTYTEIIKADGSHALGERKYTAATCTTAGNSYALCSLCGEKYDERTHEALGHNYSADGEFAKTIEATCEKDGAIYRSCTRCGEVENTVYRNLVAKGHYYFIYSDAVAPTCEKPGYTESKSCLDCGMKVEPELIPALGHKAGKDGQCERCDSLMNENGVCTCMCHKTSFFGKLIYKIFRFFWKLFKIKQICGCGVIHY